MDRVLEPLKNRIALVYLDDNIIYSKTFESHVADLKEVLIAIRRATLKLKAKKCEFATNKIVRHVSGASDNTPRDRSNRGDDPSDRETISPNEHERTTELLGFGILL